MVSALLAASLVFTPADAGLACTTAVQLVERHTPRDPGTARSALAANFLLDAASAAGADVRRDVFFAKTPKGDVPCEKESLSLGFVGPVGREALRTRAPLSEEEAVLWMKGAVEELVAKLHAGKLEFEAADHPAFAKGAALAVKLNGRAIGVMGALSAKMRHPYRLTTQMALCELELKPLLKRVNELGRVSPVPQFPLVRRDIALVAAKSVANAAIEKVIRDNGGKELVKVALFDVFKDSRAYSLEFRSAERTLTDEEVGRAFQRIVDALKATAGIEVRES